MTAKLEFTGAMRRAQAEATGKALSQGTVRILGKDGVLLAECRLGKDFSVGAQGERVAFPPLGDAKVVAKGIAEALEFVAADGKTVLGKGLSGDHLGAVVKFKDARLFEGMVITITEPFVLDLTLPRPAAA